MNRNAVIAAILLLPGCSQLDSLLYQPQTTPQRWCDTMPCVAVFSTGIILNQPISSFLVYFLGVMWFWASWRFWRIKSRGASARWWAITMGLGGLAAISAGTSYQAFPYEIKCDGRVLCVWTSWWEIAYLLLQNGSMNAMLIAVAYTCAAGTTQRRLIRFSSINFAVYFCVLAAGAYLPNKLMISFEMLVVFAVPAFLVYFYLNGLGYFRHRSAKDGVLLGAWILMVLANALYYAYYLLGYTEILWNNGYWFSANDVLHVLMLVWVIYLGTAVVKVVGKATPAQSASNPG